MTGKKSVFKTKVLPSSIIAVLTLLPTIVSVVGYVALGPDGFWENLAFVGCGLWFLGALQLAFLCVGGYLFILTVERGW